MTITNCSHISLVRLLISIIATVVFLLASVSSLFAADPSAGQKIYDQHCASCHGKGGRGVVPNTVDFSWGEGLFKSDLDLLRDIQNGRRAMPGFKAQLTEPEILDVIAYLRSLF